MKRLSTIVVAATLLVCMSGASFAQDYPTRPLRLLHGFAAGGNADAIARVLADELQKGLGQRVVVEARPGAGGTLASDQIAKATPDGYTLVLLTTAHVISAALYKSLPYDPVRDFEFISTVSELPHFIVVNAKRSPYKTLAELVAAAKSKADSLTYGTAGIGTGQHLNALLLNTSIGAKMVHVPYRGDSGAVAGLLSGDVDFIVAPLTSVSSNIDAGNFRALAVTSGNAWPTLPEIPPIATTVPEFGEVMPWTGVATTRGVPKPVVDRLNKEMRRVIAVPDVAKKLRNFGGEPASSTPEQMTEKVKSEIARWNKLIDSAGIQRN